MADAPTFNDGSMDPSPAPVDTQNVANGNNAESGSDYADFLAWKNANSTKSDAADKVDNGRKVAPTETTKSEAPAPVPVVEENPESYVWLSDGSVVRAKNEDLPAHAGGTAQYGYWQIGNSVYDIVAVYPVETVVKG